MKTHMMELDMATVETRRYRKSEVNKRVEECNSNRDFIKGPTTSFEYNEDEEFERLFNNISFNSGTDEMFSMRVRSKGSLRRKRCLPMYSNMFTTDKFEENINIQEVQCPVLRRGCNQEEFLMFEQQWGRYAECNHEVDVRELRQQLLN